MPRSVSPTGERVVAKTILLMSGERLGYHWLPSTSKSNRGFSPVGLIVQTSESVPRPLMRKMIPLPSGYQLGMLDANPVGVEVMIVRSPRPDGMRAISKLTREPGLRIGRGVRLPS